MSTSKSSRELVAAGKVRKGEKKSQEKEDDKLVPNGGMLPPQLMLPTFLCEGNCRNKTGADLLHDLGALPQ